MRITLLAASLSATALFAGCGGDSPLPNGSGPGVAPGSAAIKVLSNRSDLLSGDDALVEVLLPAGVSTARVTLNGRDVSSQFALRPNGRYMARLEGLALGSNTLRADLGGSPAIATLINYPNGGPIFSGPQVQPWVCQSTAVDAQCNQPAEYTLLYKSTNPTKLGLQPYDAVSPPSDVAAMTGADGVERPFIVRQELGYQDRDQYKIFVPWQPEQDWQPWAPQPQWNRKLLITHGGGAGGDHGAGNAPTDDYSGTIPANPVLEQSYITALGKGFAVLTTALDNNGHNVNIAVQAESLMMAKERFVEQYGELRYTIGTGCSGGSLVQQQLANAYPGIYQGLLTMCAYPDTFSAGIQFADYHLLRKYFEAPQAWGAGVVWLPTQWAAVEGHALPVNAIAADEGLFKAAIIPTSPCSGVSDAERYEPASNPGGVRCGVLDYMINVFGPRPPELWSETEQAIGRGFAGIPLGNVGVQYGLSALQQGLILPAQFVDLNLKIGGLTVDIQPTPERTPGDDFAIARMYRSGALNEANNLNTVPIINFTGPDPGIAHDAVHTFWARARLDKQHGNHDNQVIWEGPIPLIGDVQYVYQGLDAMDRWLTAMETDTRPVPIAVKVIDNKPADIHDQCSDGAGLKLLDTLCPDAVVPVYETPRIVAGDALTSDIAKCQLKPLNRDDDYGLLPFTDAQWAQLEAAFPTGVCDWSKPGVGQQNAQLWQTYQDGEGRVIYGGAPMPAMPANSRGGWMGPGFDYGR